MKEEGGEEESEVQRRVRMYFFEYILAGLLAGCFSVLISFSTAEKLQKSELISIGFSILSIPLCVVALLMIGIEKHDIKFKNMRWIAVNLGLAAYSALFSFIAYAFSFSWVICVIFIFSIFLGLYMFSRAEPIFGDIL